MVKQSLPLTNYNKISMVTKETVNGQTAFYIQEYFSTFILKRNTWAVISYCYLFCIKII